MRFAVLLLFFITLGLAVEPVLLVPGIFGTRLDYRLTCSDVSHPTLCGYSKKWDSLYANIGLVSKELILGCFSEAFSLHCDSRYKTCHPKKCFETRIHPNSLSAVSNLCGDNFACRNIALTKYFGTIIDLLVEHGYKRMTDVDAIPYDFRKSPDEWEKFFPVMLAKIRRLSKGNRKVHVLAHSNGGAVVTKFFTWMKNNHGQRLIDETINSAMLIATPIGGAPIIPGAFLTGNLLASTIPWAHVSLPGKSIYELSKGLLGLTAIWPDPAVFGDIPIVKWTDGTVMTPGNAETVLKKKGRDYLAKQVASIRKHHLSSYDMPVKNLFFAHGHDKLTTVKTWTINKDNAPKPASKFVTSSLFESGDGQVPFESIKYFYDKWCIGDTSCVMKSYVTDHNSIVSDKNFLRDMLRHLNISNVNEMALESISIQ
ncbi:hypothetical protein PCE1_000904 [Barthelona sp. PCE]